ncbi:sugar phosphate nucleotidyltransferase [Paenibacillus rhizoplanae]
MIALILAAGYATRLYPLTRDTPPSRCCLFRGAGRSWICWPPGWRCWRRFRRFSL